MKYFITACLFMILGMSSAMGQTLADLMLDTDAFINTLTSEELDRAQYSFKDSLRSKWTNLPVGLAQRPGIKYGDLSAESKLAFHHLLSNMLSSQGYLKVTGIMQLDDILNQIYKLAHDTNRINDDQYKSIQNLNWGYKNYYVSLWGKPETMGSWGVKLEGHHISINLTASGDTFTLTPLFLGTDPAEVKTTKYAGLRILNKEEDYGFDLINSLSEEQTARATLSKEVPGDIITNPNFKGRLTTFEGIKASDLNPEQKKLLRYIIAEYIGNLEHNKAREYWDKLMTSGLDSAYFAWIGSYQSLKPHYYIINTPDFIIEYDNVGFQNNGNHIHSIWREKDNDFGEDLLKTHYLNEKHGG